MLKIIRYLVIMLLLIGSMKDVHALDEPILRYVPNAEKVGEARLRVLFWTVYDSVLYTPDGKWNPDEPFALSITYLRKLSTARVVDETIKQMRQQGFEDEEKQAEWHREMTAIFPPINKNTVLTGVYTDTRETVFFDGSREVGTIKDPEFGKRFFDIWFGERTEYPKLRDQLIGK